jgi:hypothetical protein
MIIAIGRTAPGVEIARIQTVELDKIGETPFGQYWARWSRIGCDNGLVGPHQQSISPWT